MEKELLSKPDVYSKNEKEGGLLPLLTFFDYKNIACLFLRAQPPCLSACTPHKCPILVNLHLAYHFASCWNPFPPKQRIWSSVSPETEWFQLKDCGLMSQSGFRPSLSPSIWLQISTWGVWFHFPATEQVGIVDTNSKILTSSMSYIDPILLNFYNYKNSVHYNCWMRLCAIF